MINMALTSKFGFQQFYYRTSGRSSGGVDVYAITSEAIPISPVYSTGVDEGSRWKLAVISLSFSSANTRRQILLQTRFTTRSAYTAIDNIVLDGEDGTRA